MATGFLTSPSVSLTTNTKTITVTGSVDCTRVVSGTAVILGGGSIFLEGVSGTNFDINGESTITLRDTYTGSTLTNVTMTAFNTTEGLRDAIRSAREVAETSKDIQSIYGEVLTSEQENILVDINGVSTQITPYGYLKVQTEALLLNSGTAIERDVATTAEAITGTSNKLPDTIGVKAAINGTGWGVINANDETGVDVRAIDKTGYNFLINPINAPSAFSIWHTLTWGANGGSNQVKLLAPQGVDEYYMLNGSTRGYVQLYHTGNSNFNEFGTATGASVVATGSVYNSTSAFMHLNTAFLNGKASSLTVTGTFELRNAAQVVIKTNIPATDISLSIGGDRVTRILVSNLTGVTSGDFVELRALTTESKIKVNV